jgi:hypothetical protein
VGIEIELFVLLAMSVVGQSVFAVFEIETPAWRKIVKWALLVGVTLALTRVVGHWALAFPFAGGVAGLSVHFVWCGRKGIDPVHATPRRRYYELRGWTWHE